MLFESSRSTNRLNDNNDNSDLVCKKMVLSCPYRKGWRFIVCLGDKMLIICTSICVFHWNLFLTPVLSSFSRECVEKKEDPDVFFCCCEGNMCNEKFFYNPDPPVLSKAPFSDTNSKVFKGTGRFSVLCPITPSPVVTVLVLM